MRIGIAGHLEHLREHEKALVAQGHEVFKLGDGSWPMKGLDRLLFLAAYLPAPKVMQILKTNAETLHVPFLTVKAVPDMLAQLATLPSSAPLPRRDVPQEASPLSSYQSPRFGIAARKEPQAADARLEPKGSPAEEVLRPRRGDPHPPQDVIADLQAFLKEKTKLPPGFCKASVLHKAHCAWREAKGLETLTAFSFYRIMPTIGMKSVRSRETQHIPCYWLSDSAPPTTPPHEKYALRLSAEERILLQRFWDEKTRLTPGVWTASDLYKDNRAWRERQGLPLLKPLSFYKALTLLGMRSVRSPETHFVASYLVGVATPSPNEISPKGPAPLSTDAALVACSRWKWLAGMTIARKDGSTGWRLIHDGGPKKQPAVPSLSDPLTLNGILAVVEMAWPNHHVWLAPSIPEEGPPTWVLSVCKGCYEDAQDFEGTTKAEALLKALQAAPEENLNDKA